MPTLKLKYVVSIVVFMLRICISCVHTLVPNPQPAFHIHGCVFVQMQSLMASFPGPQPFTMQKVGWRPGNKAVRARETRQKDSDDREHSTYSPQIQEAQNMRSAGSVEQLYSPSYGSRTSSSQSITSKGTYK